MVAIAQRVARRLEVGAGAVPFAATLARWAVPVAALGLARPVRTPPDVRVVTVGGATLGGSGKTRLALAVVRALAARGVPVALVGHAHRARPSRARIVRDDDEVGAVGDEALACVRALATDASAPVPVVVGPSRQAAFDLAASWVSGGILVVDGPLQLRPRRADLALLAVDAVAPWGSGRTLPLGDLRAPVGALLAAADLVVPIDAGDGLDALVPQLTGLRVGLFTRIARPDRLLRALAQVGVRPVAHVAGPDHGPWTSHDAAALREARVDLWLMTRKCHVHFQSSAPAKVLDDRLTLPGPALKALLATLDPPRRSVLV